VSSFSLHPRDGSTSVCGLKKKVANQEQTESRDIEKWIVVLFSLQLVVLSMSWVQDNLLSSSSLPRLAITFMKAQPKFPYCI
jgi:hypothetical protein